jgi:hypothetical protein
MNSEGHLRLLGEGAGRSQQLELCTAQVLARALPVGESTARLLASKSGQSAILQVLDELARRRECASLDPDAVAAWVKVAQAANQARNRMIHGAWVTDGGTEVAAVFGERFDENRSEERMGTSKRHRRSGDCGKGCAPTALGVFAQSALRAPAAPLVGVLGRVRRSGQDDVVWSARKISGTGVGAVVCTLPLECWRGRTSARRVQRRPPPC